MDVACPKCQKKLVAMTHKHYMYCPRKDIVIKFGDAWNRKYKIERDPNFGCGTLFEVPLSDQDYLSELEARYKPWKTKTEHGGIKKSHTLSNSSGKSIQSGGK